MNQSKNNDKRLIDPIGKTFVQAYYSLKMFFISFPFFFAADILRTNNFLTKYAKAHHPQLGLLLILVFCLILF
jgi:hypothetical protein